MIAPLATAPTSNGIPPGVNESLIHTLEALRAEGFSPRDLIRARQMAQERRLEFISDLDAVRALRAAGVEIAPTMPKSAAFPELSSPDEGGPDLGAIEAMRKDSARRRRRLGLRSLGRLAAFVFAPTAAACLYFTFLATPIFTSHSEFVVQRPDQTAGALPGPGGALAGAALGGSQDAVAIQGFLMSRAAFEALDREAAFTRHFSDPSIDWLQRISPDADYEDRFRAYLRHVEVSFDPSEGILRMSVDAADPQTSQRFSQALLSIAEAHLDAMTEHLRDDQLTAAKAALARADTAVAGTKEKIVELQSGVSTLPGELESRLIQEQIGKIEGDLREARLSYEELAANTRPNATKLALAEKRIELLKDDLKARRASISAAAGSGSAAVQTEIALYQSELASRQEVQAQAMIALEKARAEVGRQMRYLALGVEPVLPGAAEYPRPLEHTAMAFGAFLGIYLLLSLSIALIREQMTSA